MTTHDPTDGPADASGPTARPDDGSADFVRLTRLETALSMPDRGPERVPRRSHPVGATSRGLLEQALRPALTSGPCYVMFSGGRDSSSLLALATHVARRVGADDPIPITAVHPGDAGAAETEWQHLVLAHLQLRGRWIEVELHGQQSWLGEIACAALMRHGLVWPEAAQIQGALLERIPEGVTVITGEGGDQVLDARRATLAKQSVRHPRTAIRHARAVADVLAPQRLTAAIAHRRLRRQPALPWLRPAAADAAARVYSRADFEPFSWERATRSAITGARAALVRRNFEVAIREYRLEPLNPFFDPAFASALGAEGGFWGFGDRTEQMEHLFADLLPPAVLRRTTKATFNTTRWGPQERSFARDWDGTGLDPELIDPDALRAAWLAERPPYGVALLLHAAWLAQQPT